MEFESPDVIKDFPGLYASELNTKSNNESDYSDDVDKINKTGKRRDKKEKKDRGYAALEGESSAEEDFEAKSPSKSKKSKSFKFSTKYKEKREKSREKEVVDKRKEKERKGDRVKEKIKSDKKDRKVKQLTDEAGDIAEELPIFGVKINLAIERGCCHDEIHIPLPVRACIDHLQAHGLLTENLYKISGTKSKVAHIKKLYNQRRHVDLSDYDVYTVTSLLKAFFRDLPDPILTAEQCIRFDEAAALISHTPREAHLTNLVKKLPSDNRLVLSWLIRHLHNVTVNERTNKMNSQNLAAATHSAVQTTQRVMVAFIEHSRVLFPDGPLQPYSPPLTVGAQLPDDPACIEKELRKQESLLSQIHAEMNAGYIMKQREELLWEVQRMITQLKRKLRNVQKEAVPRVQNSCEKGITEAPKEQNSIVVAEVDHHREVSPHPHHLPPPHLETAAAVVEIQAPQPEPASTVAPQPTVPPTTVASVSAPQVENGTAAPSIAVSKPPTPALMKAAPPSSVTLCLDDDPDIMLLRFKNETLSCLKGSLQAKIGAHRQEISILKGQLHPASATKITRYCGADSGDSLDEVMDLLAKENQILQIKKINLVRKIMEQHESCIDLKARLALATAQRK